MMDAKDKTHVSPPQRKSTHLQRFDYSENHRYFVTICSDNHKRMFSEIVVGEGLAPPSIKLSSIGKIIEEQINELQTRYEQITIENHVIMPNHIHMILRLENEPGGAFLSRRRHPSVLRTPPQWGDPPSPTLHDLICAFKSLVTRSCRLKGFQQKIWQRSYYEHIVRNEDDHKNIWLYINNNPAHWAEDQYYI